MSSRFTVTRYLGLKEPFWNAFDGFISKSRLQTTQNGKLVKELWWKKGKITTEIVQILDIFLRNEVWNTGIQSSRFANDLEFWNEVNKYYK